MVAWAAARLGPVLGGILVGLPIVLGPAFFFLLRAQPPEFVASVAASALFSLVATQFFLGAYIVASRSGSAILPTLAGIAAWCVVALPLSRTPHWLLPGAALFLASTVVLWLVGRRFLPQQKAVGAATRWLHLIARGIAAGLLVGLVTLTSSALGPSLAGTFVAFPVGFCVVLLSLNLDYGSAVAAQTAHAGLLGASSLATFVLALAFLLPALSPWAAFAASLVLSLLTTAALGLRSRKTRPLR